jgi:hypothetical protein
MSLRGVNECNVKKEQGNHSNGDALRFNDQTEDKKGVILTTSCVLVEA